jgi:hypothetical protein
MITNCVKRFLWIHPEEWPTKMEPNVALFISSRFIFEHGKSIYVGVQCPAELLGVATVMRLPHSASWREDILCFLFKPSTFVESSWNVMAHGDARERKWRGNWRMVASTLHTTSEHGVSSITIADEHTSAVSSQMNWRPRRFKWTSPFRRKTKFGFCACAIAFQTQSTYAAW